MPSTWLTRVHNLDCEHDAQVIERQLRSLPGVERVEAFPRSARVSVIYDPSRISPQELEAQLRELGFPPVSRNALPRPPRPWENRELLAVLVAGLLLAAGWILERAGTPHMWVLYLAATLVAGYAFTREAVEKLIHRRQVGIELLMAVAAVAAAVTGYWSEAATLAFLYGLAEALEGYTADRTRAALRYLLDLAPRTAYLLRDGRETPVPVEEVQVGDLFVVKTGQQIPTDGEIVEGRGYVDESPITGESLPVYKGPGDPVYAGSLLTHGVLQVRATRTAQDNTLARMIALVEAAQERKGQMQRFVERFGLRYSPLVLLGGGLVALVPPLLGMGPWNLWVHRAAVFIVAAAPCALVIGVPLAYVVSLGKAARHGILVKGAVHLENLARTRVVALDKTGTLTRGRPRMVQVVALNGADADAVLALAAAVEKGSQHPLAAAVVEAAEEAGLSISPAQDITEWPGKGIRGRQDGVYILVGRPEAFPAARGGSLEAQLVQWQGRGRTVVLVGRSPDGTFERAEVLGALVFRDEPREEVRQAVAAFKALGLRVVMLTGDHPETARAIAQELGLEEVYAGLRPEDKVAKIRELRKEARYVVMIGDGINDAPALAEATVGIAMGAIGSDIAMETADVVLLADDLSRVPGLIRLARRTRAAVWQIAILALAIVVGLSTLALAGSISLPLAVLVHELSEFLAVGNALRLARGGLE